MKEKSGRSILVVNTLLCILTVLSTAFFINDWSLPIKTACYGIAIIGLIFGTVVYLRKKETLLKGCFVLILCVFLLTVIVALLGSFTNLGDYKTDADKIEKLVQIIRNTGRWGKLVYIFVQILQVVILPLPAAVCYIPGSLIWDAWTATLLASLGVLIGSVIAYGIGKVFGKKVVTWIAGREATEKYSDYLGSKGKVVFVLMQILPFFPDDILCMVAGLTSMSFLFFFVTMVAVRPRIIAAYCFLGSGTVIPFEGWGIAAWIFIFIGFFVLAVLSFKYQGRFEKWLVGKFSKYRKAGVREGPRGAREHASKDKFGKDK